MCQPCGKKVAIWFCVDVNVASGSQPGARGPLGGLKKTYNDLKLRQNKLKLLHFLFEFTSSKTQT